MCCLYSLVLYVSIVLSVLYGVICFVCISWYCMCHMGCVYCIVLYVSYVLSVLYGVESVICFVCVAYYTYLLSVLHRIVFVLFCLYFMVWYLSCLICIAWYCMCHMGFLWGIELCVSCELSALLYVSYVLSVLHGSYGCLYFRVWFVSFVFSVLHGVVYVIRVFCIVWHCMCYTSAQTAVTGDTCKLCR